ncbi:unnamed protein product [Diplocarpon coronariae]
MEAFLDLDGPGTVNGTRGLETSEARGEGSSRAKRRSACRRRAEKAAELADPGRTSPAGLETTVPGSPVGDCGTSSPPRPGLLS